MADHLLDQLHSFLAHCSHRESSVPRLILADWLEDHLPQRPEWQGWPELIRLSCSPDHDRPLVAARIQSLLFSRRLVDQDINSCQRFGLVGEFHPAVGVDRWERGLPYALKICFDPHIMNSKSAAEAYGSVRRNFEINPCLGVLSIHGHVPGSWGRIRKEKQSVLPKSVVSVDCSCCSSESLSFLVNLGRHVQNLALPMRYADPAQNRQRFTWPAAMFAGFSTFFPELRQLIVDDLCNRELIEWQLPSSVEAIAVDYSSNSACF